MRSVTVSVSSPQNAFGAPLFPDIGIFGIFATESSSPDVIYRSEVSSDFVSVIEGDGDYTASKKMV